MKIKRVEAYYLKGVPTTPPPFLDKPDRADVILTEVETDDGIIGYGHCGWGLTYSIIEFINKDAAPLLIGQDPMLTERLWNQRRFVTATSGAESLGKSAIDIALWDIKGKALGLPVWRLLGGARNPVPAYITFGFPEYTLEGLVKAAKYWVKQGQDKLKIVVAASGDAKPVEEDAARVKAVAEAVGPSVQLMIDANRMLSFSNALRLAKMCEPYNMAWFEEPVYQNDPVLLANLRRMTTIPIAAGQNEGNRFRHLEFLINNSLDYLQPNVTCVGGFTEAVKVAAMAQAFNKQIANGGAFPMHNMHLQAGMANGTRVECHFTNWAIQKAVFKNTPEPVKGWLTVPETPGLGLDPKPDIVKKYRGK